MDIQVGDLFRSNRGRGALIARVVEITDGVALMQRAQSMTAKHRVSFRLSLEYLNSPKCGWKQIQQTKRRGTTREGEGAT